MRKLFLGAILILALAGAAPQGEFEAAGWRGGAFLDQRTAAFKGCIMSKAFNDAEGLSVGILPDDYLVVVVKRSAWKFEQGIPVTAEFRAGSQVMETLRVDASGPMEIRLIMKYSEALMERVSGNGKWTVAHAGKTHAYDISADKEAFNRLQTCYVTQKLINELAAKNPDLYGTPGRYDEEIMTLEVEEMLRQTGLAAAGFAILPPESRQGWFPDATLTWTDGKVMGAAYKQTTMGQDSLSVAKAMVGRMRSGCPANGYSDRAMEVKPLANGAQHWLVKQQCKTEQGGVGAIIAVFDEGGAVVTAYYHAAPLANAKAVEAPAQKVYEYQRQKFEAK